MPWYEALYPWLIHSAVVSLLVLLVGGIAVLCTYRPARRARLIEFTVAASLITPCLGLIPRYPRWSVGWQMPPAPAEGNVDQPSAAHRPVAGDLTAEGAIPARTDFPAPADVLPPQFTASSIDSRSKSPFDIPACITSLYGFGLALGGVWWLAGFVALARIRRTSWPAPQHCRELLAQISGGRDHRVAILVSRQVLQPFAFALGRPTIVLPNDFCSDEQALRWALAHEWSHLERHDLRAWMLAGLARVVFFYNPLVWCLQRQLRLAQDYLADARAARQTSHPADYAEFLVARAVAGRLRLVSAGLGIGSGKSELYRRVVMLAEGRPMETRAPRLWTAGMMLAAFVCAATLGAFSVYPTRTAQGGPAAKPNMPDPPGRVKESPIPSAGQPPTTIGGEPAAPAGFITAVGRYSLYGGRLLIQVWEDNGKIRWSGTSPAQGAGTNAAHPQTVQPSGFMNKAAPWFLFTSSPEAVWNYDGDKKLNLLRFGPGENLWREVDLVQGWTVLFQPDAIVPAAVLDRLPANLHALGNPVVRGTILDEAGKPLATADAYLPVFSGVLRVAHATSDSRGGFALDVPANWFTPMRPWDWQVTVWAYAKGHSVGTQQVSLKGGAADCVVRLGPESAASFVVLSPEGRPCVGAVVEPYYLKTQIGFQPLPELLMAHLAVAAGANGEVKLPAAPRDRLFQVRVTAKDLGVQVQRTDGMLPPGTFNGTIRLRPAGAIEGRLMADQPEIVRGIRMVFTTTKSFGATEGYADIRTDEQGRFAVPAIAAGQLRIDMLTDQSQPLQPRVPRSFRIQAGETATLEIPMVPTVQVRGSVRVKNTGEPVAGAYIHLYYGVGRQGADPVSDARGNFTARVLPGRIRMQVIYMPDKWAALAGSGSPYPEVEVPADARLVDLPTIEVVPTKSIAGRLIGPDGKPLANVWLSVLDGNRHYGHGKSDGEGRFELRGVPVTLDPANVKYQWFPETGSTFPSDCQIVGTNPLILRASPRDPKLDRPAGPQ